MRINKQKLKNGLPTIISVISILLFWVIASIVVDSKYILPSITDTLKEFFGLFGLKTFYVSYFMTLLRSVLSFLFSFILAFIICVFSRKSQSAKRFFSPIISVIRCLPTIAVILILLCWTNSFVAPIIVTMLVVFPTTIIDIDNSLSMVSDKQIEMCKMFGLNNKEIIRKVEIPQITPNLIKTVGATLSLNIKLMVAGEVLSATSKSLGLMLQTSSVDFETAKLFALVLSVIITGLIIDLIFSLIYKKVGKWL